MKRFLLVAMLLFAPIIAGATRAEAASPDGVWLLEFRDSLFRIEHCDGDRLCGTLIWLSKSSSTPEKVKYLDQMVVKYAKPTGPNTWRGEMDLLGEHVNGTVKLVNDDLLTLTGCKFLVLCKTYEMYRMPPGTTSMEPGT